jgi:hypothetical protein
VTDLSTAPAPARVRPLPPDWRHFLRHGLQVAAFNMLLWAMQMAGGDRDPWDQILVYNQATGLCIWAIIDFGRLPFLAHTTGRDRNLGLAYWPSLPITAGLLLVAVVGGWFMGHAAGDWYSGRPQWAWLQHQPRVKLRAAILSTIGASVVATFYFYSRGRSAVQREMIAAAERDATLAKLALLQSQLEPHMLFNTLANLRVLIGLDPARAQAMLDRLIAFLRATLSASRAQRHALAAEFERLDDYLQLMAVRMGPRLQVRLDLPDELRPLLVPPLLLQPLVENAIQHGLEPQVQGGRIEVSARREADALVLRVRDTGVGLAGAPPSNGTRFGVKQVRERLHTLYGDAASLALDAADDASGGGTVACIRLPFAALGADASPPSPLTTA